MTKSTADLPTNFVCTCSVCSVLVTGVKPNPNPPKRISKKGNGWYKLYVAADHNDPFSNKPCKGSGKIPKEVF